LVAASSQSRHALKQAALATQSFRIVRKIATIRLEHRGHPGKSRLEGDIRRHRSITAMRTITLEEHFATPGFLDGPGRDLKQQARQVGSRAERLMRDLCDLGEGRIAQMDAAGIDMQVVSLTAPGVEQLEAAEAVALARDTNDALAEAIARQPKRLSGFAALPIAAPDQAAKELEHRFRNQAFAGAVISGHQRGRYLDDKFFWPVLEAAEALGAPIYLHPTKPPRPVIEASFGGFAPLVTEMLAGPGFGWHIETAVHVLRMVLGGVFDRFPKLQIVIGHMGEGLPFFMQRVDVMPVELTQLKHPVSAYLRHNLHYTFAGFNFPATFLDLLLEIGVSRIMFSADYPYGSMAKARAFLDQIPVSAADRALIAHGNAERLFRL
jgi:predicted TIM-barrel fold metal-dependent hydrolase